MNNFKVEIYDNKKKEFIDYSKYAVFPFKMAELLDEQLDECEITLKRVPDIDFINPMTLVKVTLINNPGAKYTYETAFNKPKEKSNVIRSYKETTNQITETLPMLFIVASDNAIEQPVGSKKYNHQLYLIETTKILEGYIGDSISFTNTLGNSYSSDAPASYTTGSKVTVNTVPYHNINNLGKFLIVTNIEKYITWEENKYWDFTKINIYDSTRNKIYEKQFQKRVDTADEYIEINDSQTIEIEYIISGSNYIPSGPIEYESKITFYTSFVKNRLPLKKWTVTDVINRIFDTVVPLFDRQKPKFRLKGVIYDDETGNPVDVIPGSTADRLNKILAPEMTFTKMTLREMLKQVGGFIHGEPRITAINYEEGKRWYEIDFDFYGGFEYSNISKKKYVSATLRTDINEYCTSLDSSADNLVNRLDWASGVIVEPYLNGRKSLRTETVTVRMEENNSTFIATDLPIDSVYKIEWIGDDGDSVDITPYVFESATYFGELSSFAGSYPFCKAYAIYYTYGQKNIKGLFFKAPHAVSSIFHNYAIKNIIEKAKPGATVGNYTTLSFRVTYLTIYSARIRTNKQTVIGGIPRTLAYNQGANLIETRYYGENLKGVVARLGNVEKTYTYNVAFLSDIPKVGKLFDDNYYISAVATELLPSYIRVTVSLSKDFNRLSQYVGISSEKRMWEVSEKQVFERDTIIDNTVVITEKNKFNFANQNSLFESKIKNEISEILLNKDVYGNKFVSVANSLRYDKVASNPVSGRLSHSVLSVAIGNSMLFSIRFEDNYSAGQKSVYVDGDGKKDDDVTGYWGAYVPYNDYYGRFYYLHLQLYMGDVSVSSLDKHPTLEFPQITATNSKFLLDGSLTNKLGIKYRKDSREIPTITVELNAVTDNPKIIIGSALMKNCGLVNQKPKEYELYVFNRRLNTIDSTVDFDGAIKIGESESFTVNGNNIVLPNVADEHKSWAIVTARTETVINVEDDDGEQIKQTIYDGGELVLGGNEPLTNGKTLYFHIGRDVYD